MDEWNRRQHGGSGLVQQVRDSGLTAGVAEQRRRILSVAGERPVTDVRQ
jgi:oligoribonuclease (3'-5' exoribonuclease)